MDLEIAEPATEPAHGRSAANGVARRSLFARAGAAGIVGLAAALTVDHVALASPDTTVARPNVPTASDNGTLELVIGFELAASELYRAAAAGVSDGLVAAVGVMAENHQAYAQAIAGKTGLSASNMNDGIYETFVARFTGSDDDFLTAAHELEQAAVSTHTAAITGYESNEAIGLTSSILVVEARHATVLADLLGVSDFDVLFGNDQPAITLSGGGA